MSPESVPTSSIPYLLVFSLFTNNQHVWNSSVSRSFKIPSFYESPSRYVPRLASYAFYPLTYSPFVFNSIGPKTVFFWAPLMKWCLVGAGLKDLTRPADKLSVSQNLGKPLPTSQLKSPDFHCSFGRHGIHLGAILIRDHTRKLQFGCCMTSSLLTETALTIRLGQLLRRIVRSQSTRTNCPVSRNFNKNIVHWSNGDQSYQYTNPEARKSA
jgi:hypothetical protein